jgi:thymidine phosphorylase
MTAAYHFLFCANAQSSVRPKTRTRLAILERLSSSSAEKFRRSRAKLALWLSDGTAWRRFISLVHTKDGDASSLEKSLKCTAHRSFTPCSRIPLGPLTKWMPKQLGAQLLLGAGRQKADDAIDFAVGFSAIKKIGERVETGEPLLSVRARSDQTLLAVLPLLEAAVEIS